MIVARPEQSTAWEIRLLGEPTITNRSPGVIRIHKVLRLCLDEATEEPEAQTALAVARREISKLQVSADVQLVSAWMDYATNHFQAVVDDRLRTAALEAFAAANPPTAAELPPESPSANRRPATRGDVQRLVLDAARTLSWELDPDQSAGAVEIISRFLLPQGPLRTTESLVTLGGYAGTGKTVLLRLIAFVAMQLQIPVMVLTPTGKAGARMREVVRGTPGLESLPVLTLHAAIYGRPTDTGRCPVEDCGEWSSEIIEVHPDDTGGYRECPHCRGRHAAGTTLEQRILFSAPRTFCADGTWVLIDECTMVGEEVGKDLHIAVGRVSDCHVLATGDPGQLDPVKARAAFDMTSPDVLLTKIHRQGAGNPILLIAERLRAPVSRAPWLLSELRGVFGDRGEASARVHANVGVAHAASWLGQHLRAKADATLITHSNKTRVLANNAVRSWANLPPFRTPQAYGPALPVFQSERLICLQNNSIRGIMNGETATVESIEYVTPLPVEFHGWIAEHTLCRVKLVGIAEPVYIFGDTFEDTPEIPDSGNVFRGRIGQLRRAVGQAFHRWLRTVRQSPGTPRHLREAPDDDPELLALFLDCFGDLIPENFLHVTYGYCVSVYKSQGSQWRHVGIVWDYAFGRGATNPGGQKLAYTAVTRAAVGLDVFVVSDR